jgi:glutamate N-acetyltransferase / amino-acid N-acetyltransferase
MKSSQVTVIEGGVTAAQGFQAAGAHVGLKRKRKDLSLVYSQTPCDFGAVFTTNVAKGAPIIWNQQVVAAGQKLHAIVTNSGNANACTGAPGIVHAQQMAHAVADCLGVNAHQVLVASTGIIGIPLPIDTVLKGIKTTAKLLAEELQMGTAAAEAIMTTDSFVKQMAVQFEIGGKLVTLGAMAKGSGMVHPNMATMLSFITTDLAISSEMLQKALAGSVDSTYNMISVDGDTSTNDMVAILANGLAGNDKIVEENDDYATFVAILNLVNQVLAKHIASDGEGATKLVEVVVNGAKSLSDARKLARAVVSSNLVKTAFYAQDANWGRIIAALGGCGADFDPTKLSVQMYAGGYEVALLLDGIPCWIEERECFDVLVEQEIKVVIDLCDGEFNAAAWGCDLTPDYIRLNGSYRSAHVVGLTMSKEGVA